MTTQTKEIEKSQQESKEAGGHYGSVSRTKSKMPRVELMSTHLFLRQKSAHRQHAAAGDFLLES